MSNPAVNQAPALISTKIGVVVSDARNKTRTVAVEAYFVHPKYGKRIAREVRFHIHDELNASQNGDRVEIVPCRPMSKTKRFRLVRVVQKGAVQNAALVA